MADCVFCRIVKGEIPAQRVYENERILAILDINPISPGHTLVMAREHHETWTDLPPDLAGDLARASQAVARGILKATGAEGFNLLMNNRPCSGQAIPHAHVHVIPRRSKDGVRYEWKTRPYEPGQIEKIADSVRSALK